MKIQVALLSCMLAGCAASHSGPPVSTPPQLEGSSWSLATASDSNGVISALVSKPGKPVALTFKDGRIRISEACNRMGGQFALTGNSLKVEQLMSTKMACEPALMKAEAEIARQMEGESTVEMSGEQLVLKTPHGATLNFDRN